MIVLTKTINIVLLTITVYENEEPANLACVNDSNGICSRPHINPMSYSHPLQLSLTPDGTHNGGTALEPLNTGNSSVNATAQSFNIQITADTEKITEPTKVYYYCEEHPNMGGILNIIPCESTPTPTQTPIAQQDPTPTPTPTPTETPTSLDDPLPASYPDGYIELNYQNTDEIILHPFCSLDSANSDKNFRIDYFDESYELHRKH